MRTVTIALALMLLAFLVVTTAEAEGGPIVAWGDNYRGQCNVSAPNLDFVAMAGGGAHSLGLKSDSTIVAWGYDGYGQCTIPSPNAGFVAIAASGDHSLGLKADGTIVAWGSDLAGETIVPSRNADFVAVACGAYHSLGLKSDSTIVAWGLNYYGACTVPAPNADFVAVAGGAYHSLGLKADGTIRAWGDNSYGQCTIPSPNAGFVALAAGEMHSLGLKADGTIVAWGGNWNGECDVPSPNTGFVAVAAGPLRSLGLKSDGTVVAWGDNFVGQGSVPAPNSDFSAIATGSYHSLGLKAPLVGACCHNDGVCTYTLQEDCLTPSVWQGERTSCSPNPCPAPDKTLCEVAEDDAYGVAVLLGKRVKVTGLALCNGDAWSKPPTNPTIREFQITDGVCCITVFGGDSSPTVGAGDSVVVSGTVANWNGKTEITTPDLTVTVLSSGHPLPAPGMTTTGTLATAGEPYESCLFRVRCVTLVGGTWPTGRWDANITVNDGTGDVLMRLDKDTDCWTMPAPTGRFTVTGIGDQFGTWSAPYNTGWQIKPRGPSDIDTTASAGCEKADLVVSAMSAPASVFAGTSFSVDWTVRNDGTLETNVPAWHDAVYVSDDDHWSPDDLELAIVSNPMSLRPGESYSHSGVACVIPTSRAGSRFLIVRTDSRAELDEGGATLNNTRSSPIQVRLRYPDLQVSAISAPATMQSGATVPLEWTVVNAGDAATNAQAWNDAVYLSADSTGSLGTYLGWFTNPTYLQPGEAYVQRNRQVTIPWELSGTWYLRVKTDATYSVYEVGHEDNNVRASAPIAVGFVRRPTPDLAVRQITVPATAFAGERVNVTWRLKNIGTAEIAGKIFEIMLTSPDSVRGGNDWELDHGIQDQLGRLAPGDSVTFTRSVLVPADWRGLHYLYLWSNSMQQPAELDYANNYSRLVPIDVSVYPPPDLELTTLAVMPTTVPSGSAMAVHWEVFNNGLGSTRSGTWTDRAYASADSTVDPAQDVLLGEVRHTGAALAVGGSYAVDRSFVIPSGWDGPRTIFVCTDVLNNISDEVSESNNCANVPIEIVARPVDLAVTDVSLSAPLRSGQIGTVTYTVENLGTGETDPSRWIDRIYLSEDAVLDTSDVLLSEVVHDGGLHPGSPYVVNKSVTLPNGMAGPKLFLVVTDASGVLPESNEGNNQGSATGEVTLTPPADLVVNSLDVSGDLHAGSSCSVNWIGLNQGPGATEKSVWDDGLYLSRDASLGGADLLLARFPHIGTAGAGQEYSESRSVTLPADSVGNFFLLLHLDDRNDVYEHSFEGNNTQARAVSIATRLRPDLIPDNVTATPGAHAGEVRVTYRVRNAGAVSTGSPSFWDRIYLSADDNLDLAQDQLLSTPPELPHMNPGQSRDVDVVLPLPRGTGGDRYLFVLADAINVIAEEQEGNNVARSGVITLPVPDADLDIVEVSSPVAATSGQRMTASFLVRNVGTSTTPASRWNDALYLSADEVLDASDLCLGSKTRTTFLAGSDEYLVTISDAYIPLGIAGPRYLIARTDVYDAVWENDREANNLAVSTQPILVTLPAPCDLVVTSVQPAGAVQLGKPLAVSWQVTNLGGNPVSGYWTDAVYLSADSTWDVNDVQLGEVTVNGLSLARSESYQRTLSLSTESLQTLLNAPVPGVEPGSYRVIVRTDIRNQIFESDEANNALASPGPVQAECEALTPGSPHAFELGVGTSAYFCTQVEPGNDVRVRVTGAPGTPIEVYTSNAGIPSRLNYQKLLAGAGEVDGVVAMRAEGSLSVLVRRTAGSDGSLVIATEAVPFQIFSAVPAAIGDNGYVTVTLSGAGFPDGCRAWLDGPSRVEAQRVQRKDNATLEARFELRDEPNGHYDVGVTRPDSTSATLQGAMSVGAVAAAEPTIEIDGSWGARPRALIPFTASITNTNNMDIAYLLVVIQVDDSLAVIQDGYGARLPTFESEADYSSRYRGGTARSFTVRDVKPGGQVVVPFDIRLSDNDEHSLLVTATPNSLAEILSLTLATAEDNRRRLANEAWVQEEDLSDSLRAALGDSTIWAEWALDWLTRSGLVDLPEAKAVIAEATFGKPIRGQGPRLAGEPTPAPTPVVCGDCKTKYPDWNESCTDIAGEKYAECCGGLASMCKNNPTRASTCTGTLVYYQMHCQDKYDACVKLQMKIPRCCQQLSSRDSRKFCPTKEPSALRGGFQVMAEEDPSAGGSGCAGGCEDPPTSSDPNEKRVSVPGGIGPEIADGELLNYSLFFENLPAAEAPAADVWVTDSLSSSLDIRTFRLTEIVLPETTIVFPPDQALAAGALTLAKGMLLRYQAGVEPSTGIASWQFHTIDPTTGQLPVDPMIGFLAPNDSTGRGEGHVSFSVRVKEGVEPGSIIPNTATIVFDVNPPIATNEVVNVVRGLLPDLRPNAGSVQAGLLGLMEGEPGTIRATIGNTGEIGSGPVSIAFLDATADSGATLVGGAELGGGVPLGEEREVSIAWVPQRVLGERVVRVIVDGAGQIPELDESNNQLEVRAVVQPRTYGVNLAAGINLVGPPLDPGASGDADRFARSLGARMLVRADSTGLFESYLPGESGTDPFPLQPGAGYIALVDSAHTAVLEGMTNPGTVKLQDGLELFSLPLRPEQPLTARDLAAATGAEAVIRYDTGSSHFEPFLPSFHQGEGFPIEGGVGYALVLPADSTATFAGTGWLGQQDPTLLVQTATQTEASKDSSATWERPVLALLGAVRRQDGNGASPIGLECRLVVRNARTKAVTRAFVNAATGRFGAACVDISGGTTVRSGDVLSIQLESPEGTAIGDPIAYTVSRGDVQRWFARLGDLVVAVPPAQTLVQFSGPNPFRGQTLVHYQLAAAGKVSLKVFSVDGRLVRTLVDEQVKAGYYAAVWDGATEAKRNAAAGVYFYRFTAPGYSATHKIVRLR
jgi:subtilase family serine protease